MAEQADIMEHDGDAGVSKGKKRAREGEGGENDASMLPPEKGGKQTPVR